MHGVARLCSVRRVEVIHNPRTAYGVSGHYRSRLQIYTV